MSSKSNKVILNSLILHTFYEERAKFGMENLDPLSVFLFGFIIASTFL